MSIVVLLLCSLHLLGGAFARPSEINSLVMIGDSFSDNGTGAYRLTNYTWPADPAYDHGRFSNGPVWVEDVAKKFGWKLEDYVVGGASSNNTAVQGYTGPQSSIPVPSALDQLAQYLHSPSTSPRSTVFAIFIGANDIFFDPKISPATPLAATSFIVHKLKKSGATKFAVATYPDFSKIPYGAKYVDADTAAGLKAYASALRSGIFNLAQELRKQGLEVAVVDTFALFEEVLAYPARYGFSKEDLKNSCLTGAYGEAPKSLCHDPEKFVWWDEFHPTGKSHRYVAAVAAKAMQKEFGI